MGKTVAYMVAAILLGTVAMLPVMVLTPKMADQGYDADKEYLLPCFKNDVERSQLQEEFGLAKAPLNPFHLGLIIIVSFVFASGVSFYFKRRRF